MNEMQLTMSVVVLFVARIGLPMLVLIGSGILIDHWQSHRHSQRWH